ncbi:MAG TPA: S8 family serine peptidase, partial [Ramlibacter sp.]
MHAWSNACGVAMDNCLVAAGDVKVPDPHDAASGLVVEHSTDYAAAQVSGAAALVLEKFKYFDGELLRQTLLGSATDLGAPGVDPIYGWGRLNVEKALKGLSRLDWGDVRLDLSRWQNSGWAGELGNDISGDGGLTIDSNGRSMLLWMSGHNTYKGKTRITGGFTLALYGHIESDVEVGDSTHLVLADASSLGGDVRMESRAGLTIGNDGTTQAGNSAPVRIDGSVSGPGNLFASRSTPLTIGGDLQLLGGQVSTWLGAPPVAVEGRVWLDGTMLTIRGPVASYVANTDTVLLTTGQGLSGRFNIVNWGTTTPLIDASLAYDPLSVRVVYARQNATATAMGLALSPAAVGSATRVEGAFDRIDAGLADGSLSDASGFVADAGAIQQGNAQQLGAMLDSLSGELHDADSAFAALAVEGSRRALDERVDAFVNGTRPGAWHRQLDDRRGWSAFDVDAKGWMLGFDNAWRHDMTVGASLSETSGHAWHGQRYDRERNRQVDAQ